MPMRWGAVIAAGGQAKPELAREIGQNVKGLARFGDRTSLAYVLAAVAEAGLERVVTVGPESVRLDLAVGEWRLEGDNAVDNVRLGLSALGHAVEAALLLPADAPLISAPMLQRFMQSVESRASGAEPWCAAGICPAEEFASAFPGAPMRTIGLREGKFVSGALYAATPTAIHNALEILTHMRRARNRPFAMVRRLGLWNLLRYGMGRVGIADAERVVGAAFDSRAMIDPTAHPATCMDFDTVEEYRLLQRWFQRRHAMPN